MTPARSRRIVIFCLAAGAALAVARKFTDRQAPSPRIALGAFTAAVILLGVADTAPQLAAGLALTSLIGGTIAAGPDAFTAYSAHLTKDTPS